MHGPLVFSLQNSVAAVDALFAMNAQIRPEMGPRDHAAWVMNVLAHGLGPWLASRDEAGDLAATGEDLHLSARIAPEGWLTFDFDAAPPMRAGCPAEAPAPAAVAARAVALFFAAPVGAFALAGGLAPGALWRIVGDGMGWGFAQNGAHERGQAVLTSPGAPFANRQLQLAKDGVRRRGGCCRWLSVNGETCANCPLRKTDERKKGG